MSAVFLQASEKDVDELIEFLGSAKLNVEEVQNQYDYYLIAKNQNGRLIGAAGLIPCGKYGLLRSCVFASSFPKEKIPFLIEHLLLSASMHKLESVYMATDKISSIHFFKSFGFTEAETTQLPEEIKSSPHVEKLKKLENCQFMHRIL